MTLHLVIKALRPNGQPPLEFPIDIDSSATVEELKEQIAGRVELPQDNIRLVCAGRIWENAHTVGSYGASEGSVVHCLNNPPKQAPAAASQTLVAADPLQQMLGGGGMAAPAPSGDPMQQMIAQAQQQMTQNPEMMQQILNSPMVQQMMSNPDTIRAMARLNPQLNQLMEQRPEIARLLEDPEMLQQSMRMMANPALMREMTRNADRAIGQLDAMPGGHNALRRAHEEYADPLFDAITAEVQLERRLQAPPTTRNPPRAIPTLRLCQTHGDLQLQHQQLQLLDQLQLQLQCLHQIRWEVTCHKQPRPGLGQLVWGWAELRRS